MAKKSKDLFTKGRGKIVTITGQIKGKMACEHDPLFSIEFEDPNAAVHNFQVNDTPDFFAIPHPSDPVIFKAILLWPNNETLLSGEILTINNTTGEGTITPDSKKVPVMFSQKKIRQLKLAKGSRVNYFIKKGKAYGVHPEQKVKRSGKS
jgi:hypothetical protein